MNIEFNKAHKTRDMDKDLEKLKINSSNLNIYCNEWFSSNQIPIFVILLLY